jgi:hypothetical protein
MPTYRVTPYILLRARRSPGLMEISYQDIESAKIGLAGLKSYVIVMHNRWTTAWDDGSRMSFTAWDEMGVEAQKGHVEMIL